MRVLGQFTVGVDRLDHVLARFIQLATGNDQRVVDVIVLGLVLEALLELFVVFPPGRKETTTVCQVGRNSAPSK